MEKLSNLISDPSMITLFKGSHGSRDEGVCLMEAVAWWVGEPHSDQPMCVDPMVASMGRNFNDTMLDHYRLRFAKLIPSLAGTATDGLREARKQALWIFILDTLLPALMAERWLDASNISRTWSKTAQDNLNALMVDSPIQIKPTEKKSPLAQCVIAFGDNYVNDLASLADEETLIDLQATLADWYEQWVLDPQSLLEAPESAVEALEAPEAVVVHPEPVEPVQETVKAIDEVLVNA